MKIGIDARLWQETGVGRYIRALTENLQSTDQKNEYVLFLRQSEYETLSVPQRWSKILANIHWHTIDEQIKMPGIYKSGHVDLLHVPYFSVPLFIPQPFVVTIHDLTISHFATGRATTRPYPLYILKRFGYRLVLSQAVRRAARIITVSETVKKELIQEYSLNPGMITVTYEAGNLEGKNQKNVEKPPQYILYVGNAHPHKNLEFFVRAFSELRTHFPKLKLVLIGKKDFFYDRIMSLVKRKNLEAFVLFPGQVSNAELASWYRGAKAFVFPSLSEGFGIPGLEAMQLSCPVVVSDISIFHEIYGEAAMYFDPKSTIDFIKKMTLTLNDVELRKKLISQGTIKSSEYSWKKMAQETLIIYESCARI